MWLIIVSFSALFSFADLGMGNGVLNQVSHAYGREDNEAIKKVISSGYGALCVVAVVVLLVFILAYPHVPWFKIFNVESKAAQAEAGPAIAAFISCFSLAIPFGIVQKVQIGMQRSFLSNLWQCGSSIMSLVGVLVVISFQGGLMWLVIAFMGVPLLASLLNSIIFFGRMMPQISPSPSLVSKSVIRKITKTGVLFFVLQIVSAVAYSSDGLVIAHVLGVSSVPQFSIPEKLFAVIAGVVQMLLAPLWPAYGEALVRRDLAWVKNTLKHSVVVSVTLAFIGSVLLISFFPFILKVWVHNKVNPPVMLVLGFGTWKVIEAVGFAMAMFLNGANVVSFQIIVSILTGISALILKIVFVHHFGVGGTVWATIASFSVFALVPCAFKIKSMLNEKVSRA